jgi:hypothetical protein
MAPGAKPAAENFADLGCGAWRAGAASGAQGCEVDDEPASQLVVAFPAPDREACGGGASRLRLNPGRRTRESLAYRRARPLPRGRLSAGYTISGPASGKQHCVMNWDEELGVGVQMNCIRLPDLDQFGAFCQAHSRFILSEAIFGQTTAGEIEDSKFEEAVGKYEHRNHLPE